MLDFITEKFPGGCEIYIANIYDSGERGGQESPGIDLPNWKDGLAIHAAYNEVIVECARSRNHVHVVPIYEILFGHGPDCQQFWRTIYDWEDPAYWHYINIRDPIDHGYDAVRRKFLQVILKNTKLRSGELSGQPQIKPLAEPIQLGTIAP